MGGYIYPFAQRGVQDGENDESCRLQYDLLPIENQCFSCGMASIPRNIWLSLRNASKSERSEKMRNKRGRNERGNDWNTSVNVGK